jgi:hypothetical protein
MNPPTDLSISYQNETYIFSLPIEMDCDANKAFELIMSVINKKNIKNAKSIFAHIYPTTDNVDYGPVKLSVYIYTYDKEERKKILRGKLLSLKKNK